MLPTTSLDFLVNCHPKQFMKQQGQLKQASISLKEWEQSCEYGCWAQHGLAALEQHYRKDFTSHELVGKLDEVAALRARGVEGEWLRLYEVVGMERNPEWANTDYPFWPEENDADARDAQIKDAAKKMSEASRGLARNPPCY